MRLNFVAFGKDYVFFIGDYQGHPNILKVLPDGRENIEAVRKEIELRKPGR